MSETNPDGPTKGKICPQPDCNHTNPADSRYCAHCGKSLAEVVASLLVGDQHLDHPSEDPQKCPEQTCGHMNHTDARHCSRCGKRLDTTSPNEDKPKSPLKEITQPFIDLVHAPRALWGINLAYIIEGMCYFGIVTGCLHMYFNDYVGLSDVSAGAMIGVLTGGITISMFFLGTVADRKGVRFALLAAFILMLCGRFLISSAPLVDPSNIRVSADKACRNDPALLFTDATPVPVEKTDTATGDTADANTVGQTPTEDHAVAEASAPQDTASQGAEQGTASQPSDGGTANSASPGLWSVAHILALCGILLVAIGYGMYQPGAYAAVRQFTTPKTAAMGFAMLYALMNLGGWIPSLAPILRTDKVDVGGGAITGAGVGILGMVWVYTGFTILSLLVSWFILSRRTVDAAIAAAKAETDAGSVKSDASSDGRTAPDATAKPDEDLRIPLHMWGCLAVAMIPVYFIPDGWGVPWRFAIWGVLLLGPVVIRSLPDGVRLPIMRWLAHHPLADAKFFFFIFALIPVQTLFAHNWLTLPMYVERGYRETWPWISKNWEFASNFNPLLVFVFVPIVTALTRKAKVYNMMIVGTLIMAAPTFLLTLGPHWWTLLAFLVIMTAGEAMWQPRFLQYAAEIAPEGRTGAYMGVAQFPWFLTKVIVPIYAGWFLTEYCPQQGEMNTESMWFIYACIAMASTVLLVLAKGWAGKDFKTKAA